MAFQEMADGSQSKQLARLEAKVSKEGDKITVKYTRLDGDEPKPGQSATNLVTNLSTDLQKALNQMKVGDEAVIIKTKKGKFWNLTGVEDKSTFVKKESKPFVKNSGNYNNNKSNYDTTGVKVGAARNQAIAFLAATQGNKFTLDDVDAVARDVVKRQQAQEDEMRAGMSVPMISEGAANRDSTSANAKIEFTKASVGLSQEPSVIDDSDISWD